MKLTVVNAGLILALLFVYYEPSASKAIDRIDRSGFGSTISPKDVVQGRQAYPDDDYEDEEYEEEEDELQQSLNEQNGVEQAGGDDGGGGGGEEEEDDNEDDEGDDEEEEDDDEDQQRFMENKRFLQAVYDIL